MAKYCINESEVKPATDLKHEDGWNRMQVQRLCTEANFGSKLTVMGRTIFPPNGAAHELHYHENAEEVIYILRGHGRALVNDEEFDFKEGDVIFVPVGAPHFIRNTDPVEELEHIWVYGGVGSIEKSGYHHCKTEEE